MLTRLNEKGRWKVNVSVIGVLFSGHRKCLDMLSNYGIGVESCFPPVIVEPPIRSRARLVSVLVSQEAF